MAGKFSSFKLINDLNEDEGNAIEKKGSKDNGKPWFFKPGLYKDCVVKSIEETGTAVKDETWLKFTVVIAQEKREIKHFIMVPTQKLSYGENNSHYPFVSLQRFLAPFGVALDKNNAAEIIPAIFDKPEVLVGMRCDIVVGHKGNYAHSIGDNSFHCLDRDNKPVLGPDKTNPIVFPSRDAVQNYVEETLKQEFDAWPSVKFFNEPTTANTKVLPTKVEAAPKKKATVSF